MSAISTCNTRYDITGTHSRLRIPLSAFTSDHHRQGHHSRSVLSMTQPSFMPWWHVRSS